MFTFKSKSNKENENNASANPNVNSHTLPAIQYTFTKIQQITISYRGSKTGAAAIPSLNSFLPNDLYNRQPLKELSRSSPRRHESHKSNRNHNRGSHAKPISLTFKPVNRIEIFINQSQAGQPIIPVTPLGSNMGSNIAATAATASNTTSVNRSAAIANTAAANILVASPPIFHHQPYSFFNNATPRHFSSAFTPPASPPLYQSRTAANENQHLAIVPKSNVLVKPQKELNGIVKRYSVFKSNNTIAADILNLLPSRALLRYAFEFLNESLKKNTNQIKSYHKASHEKAITQIRISLIKIIELKRQIEKDLSLVNAIKQDPKTKCENLKIEALQRSVGITYIHSVIKQLKNDADNTFQPLTLIYALLSSKKPTYENPDFLNRQRESVTHSLQFILLLLIRNNLRNIFSLEEHQDNQYEQEKHRQEAQSLPSIQLFQTPMQRNIPKRIPGTAPAAFLSSSPQRHFDSPTRAELQALVGREKENLTPTQVVLFPFWDKMWAGKRSERRQYLIELLEGFTRKPPTQAFRHALNKLSMISSIQNALDNEPAISKIFKITKGLLASIKTDRTLAHLSLFKQGSFAEEWLNALNQLFNNRRGDTMLQAPINGKIDSESTATAVTTNANAAAVPCTPPTSSVARKKPLAITATLTRKAAIRFFQLIRLTNSKKIQPDVADEECSAIPGIDNVGDIKPEELAKIAKDVLGDDADAVLKQLEESSKGDAAEPTSPNAVITAAAASPSTAATASASAAAKPPTLSTPLKPTAAASADDLAEMESFNLSTAPDTAANAAASSSSPAFAGSPATSSIITSHTPNGGKNTEETALVKQEKRKNKKLSKRLEEVEEKAKKENEELLSDNQRLVKEKSEQEKALKKLKEELDAEKEKTKKTEENLSTEFETQREKLVSTESLSEQYKKRAESLLAELKAIQEAHIALLQMHNEKKKRAKHLVKGLFKKAVLQIIHEKRLLRTESNFINLRLQNAAQQKEHQQQIANLTTELEEARRLNKTLLDQALKEKEVHKQRMTKLDQRENVLRTEQEEVEHEIQTLTEQFAEIKIAKEMASEQVQNNSQSKQKLSEHLASLNLKTSQFIVGYQREKQTLAQKLMETESRLQRNTETLTRLQTDHTELLTAKAALEQNLTSASSKESSQSTTLSALQNQLNSVQQLASERESVITEITVANKTLKSECTRLTAAQQKLSQSFNEQTSFLTAKFENANQTAEKIQNQYTALLREQSALSATLAAKEKQINELTSEKTNLQKANQNLLREKDELISALQQTESSFRNQHIQQQSTIQELTEKLTALQEQNSAQKEDFEKRISDQKNAYESQKQQLMTELSEANARLQTTTALLVEAQNNLQSTQTKRTEAENDLTTLRAESAEAKLKFEAANKALKEQIASNENTIKTNNERLSQSANEQQTSTTLISQLQKTNEELKTASERLTQEQNHLVQNHTAVITALNKRISEIESETLKARSQIAEILVLHNALENAHKTQTEQLMALQLKYSTLEKQHNALQTQKADLERQLTNKAATSATSMIGMSSYWMLSAHAQVANGARPAPIPSTAAASANAATNAATNAAANTAANINANGPKT